MKKTLAVTVLCVALIGGAVMAPALHQVLTLRLTMALNPHLLTTEAGSSAFAEILIEFFKQYVINGAFGGAASSLIGEGEKKNASSQEATQSQVNQTSMMTETETVADVQSTFTPGNVIRACRIANEEKETQNGALNAHLESKGVAAVEALEFSKGSPSLQAAGAILSEHNEKYCSQDSINRGRCTTLSKMPNADMQAGTLLAGDGSETFTKEQYEAARAFMRVVTDPVPPEAMPQAAEQTPAGQRYLLERMQYDAMMSMSQQTFSRILASRSPNSK